MKPFFILVAVLVMLRLASALLVLNELLRRRLWRTRVRLAVEQEVPPHVREGLRPPVAELEALGFEPLGWMAIERERPGGDAPRFSARLFHGAMGAYATVAFSSMPDPGAPWFVTFSSPGADGRLVKTFGGGEQSSLAEPPETISVAPYAPTIPLQWKAHCAAVHTANIVPPALDHDAFFTASRDRQDAHFDSLVQSRQLLAAEGPAYAYSLPLGLRVTRAALSARRALHAQRAERARLQRASLQTPPTIPVEEEIAAYERYVESTSGRPRASFLLALFAVTVPLFVAAGSYSMGAATTAAVVLGIVLFHEAGHYLAMRGFGYVDTTILLRSLSGRHRHRPQGRRHARAADGRAARGAAPGANHRALSRAGPCPVAPVAARAAALARGDQPLQLAPDPPARRRPESPTCSSLLDAPGSTSRPGPLPEWVWSSSGGRRPGSFSACWVA